MSRTAYRDRYANGRGKLLTSASRGRLGPLSSQNERIAAHGYFEFEDLRRTAVGIGVAVEPGLAFHSADVDIEAMADAPAIASRQLIESRLFYLSPVPGGIAV